MEARQGSSDLERNLVDFLPIFSRELIAGGTAGACSKTVVAPLERVKILFQTRTSLFRSLGVFQSLSKIKEHDGLVGLYRGNSASVARVVPYAALHFMAYERYKGWMVVNYSSLGNGSLVDLLAGSAAGATAVLCTYPLDLARAKLAFQVGEVEPKYNGRNSYRGISDVLKAVYMEGGVRSLYRGIGPTLLGILPYAGLKFFIYEDLKARAPPNYRDSVFLRLSCGALAGLFGQTLTYPLDVIRRQMQVQTQTGKGPIIRGTFQGLAAISRDHGWRRLFAGLSVNYLKVVPSAAIGFTAYDNMKALLRVPPRDQRS